MPDGGETSVFRHEPAPIDRLYMFGVDYAAGTRTLRAAAILKGSQIRAETLLIEPNEPPTRHALILGWASHPDAATQEAAQKQQALRLAERAVLILWGANSIPANT